MGAAEVRGDLGGHSLVPGSWVGLCCWWSTSYQHALQQACSVCSRAAGTEPEISGKLKQIERPYRKQTGEWGIHPLLDQGADVFSRDVGDGLEEAVSGHQHLTPHLTLVFLGWGCAGQTQKLVKNLVRGEKSPIKMMDFDSCGQRRTNRDWPAA